MSNEVTSRNSGGSTSGVGGSACGGPVGNSSSATGISCVSGSTSNIGGVSGGGFTSASNQHHNNVQMSKADEIEIQVIDHNPDQPEIKVRH